MSNENDPEGVVSTGGRRYIFVHSRLNEDTTAELDAVVKYMGEDTELRRLIETPGRPDGMRFAIGVAARWVEEQKRKAETAGG